MKNDPAPDRSIDKAPDTETSGSFRGPGRTQVTLPGAAPRRSSGPKRSVGMTASPRRIRPCARRSIADVECPRGRWTSISLACCSIARVAKVSRKQCGCTLAIPHSSHSRWKIVRVQQLRQSTTSGRAVYRLTARWSATLPPPRRRIRTSVRPTSERRSESEPASGNPFSDEGRYR